MESSLGADPTLTSDGGSEDVDGTAGAGACTGTDTDTDTATDTDMPTGTGTDTGEVEEELANDVECLEGAPDGLERDGSDGGRLGDDDQDEDDDLDEGTHPDNHGAAVSQAAKDCKTDLGEAKNHGQCVREVAQKHEAPQPPAKDAAEDPADEVTTAPEPAPAPAPAPATEEQADAASAPASVKAAPPAHSNAGGNGGGKN